MRIAAQTLALLLTLSTGTATAGSPLPPQEPRESQESRDTAGNETPETPSYPIPDNLVLDLRLFESRALSPNYTAMSDLNFFIMTDGRDVTATQWPSTLAKQVPDTFLAALFADTVPVRQGVARFEWTRRSRRIQTEIRVENYHPAGTFKAQLQTQFLRGDETMGEHRRELDLQMHRTLVWSSDDLEMAPTDYLSHFREYADRESRGLLYELLRPNTFFLIFAATPRLLTKEESRLGSAETVSLPPGVDPPRLANPTGVPLQGTIILGFEVDENGRPINPQIVRSSFPEANLQVAEEAAQWQFPAPPDGARRVQVELDLRVPVGSP